MLAHTRLLLRQTSLSAALALFVAIPAALGDANPAATLLGDPVARNLRSILKVSDLTLIDIDDAPVQAENSKVVFTLEGQSVTMNVFPHSVRADDFQVLIEGVNGLTPIDPGPVRTIRGSISEFPGSIVTGSIVPAGMEVRIQLPSGKAYGLTSARRHIPTASATRFALYDLADSIEPVGECGSELPGGGAGLAGAGTKGDDSCEPIGPFICRLGCDTEAPFIASFPGTPAEERAAAQQWIEDNVNEINAVVYEQAPVSTTHIIARIVLRTAANDIYAGISNGSTVLSTLRNEWRTTQADADAQISALWLGRNLDGNVVGLGYIGGVCSPSACWVEKRSGNQRLNLLAHELGHNWGANHCNQNNYPGDVCTVCTASCPIMSSTLISCGNPSFSQCVLDEILDRRTHYECIEDLGFTAPTVLDEGVVLSDGDTVTMPEVLTGQTSTLLLHIRNNQNCTLPIRVRLFNATGQFTLPNAPTSIPPLGTVPVSVEFTATFAGDSTADVEITTDDFLSGYVFGLHLEATAGVGANLPGAAELLCPFPWATTMQPKEVVFQWAPSDFVESYQFQILSSTDQVLYNQPGIRGYSHRPDGLTVPAGQSYLWKVTAHNANGSAPAASGFFVDPAAAVPEMHISHRFIPVANNATLNLPLDPNTITFDFDVQNNSAVELNLSNITIPEGFSLRLIGGFGTGGFEGEGQEGPMLARIRACGGVTLRLFATDSTIINGNDPVMGTLEFDTNDPAYPHFAVNLCFRCEPYSCFGDPFSGCGVVTHVTQGGCWHFVADCGTEFGLRNFGDFSIGDTIWVTGAVDPDTEFCFPQVQLPQIPDPRVGACVTVTGELLNGPPCYAAPCPLRIRTSAGAIYDVENTEGFNVGDRVTVEGGLISYSSFANTSQGFIFGNTIERAAERGRFDMGG